MDFQDRMKESEMGDVLKRSREKMARALFGRSILLVFSVLAQFVVLYLFATWFYYYRVAANWAFLFMGAVMVIAILNGKSNPAYKIAWIIPIIVFPVFGGLLYLLVHIRPASVRLNKSYQLQQEQTKPYLQTEETVRSHLQEISLHRVGLARYIQEEAGYASFQNTKVTYFPSGEAHFDTFLQDLENAKDFIFLEYFIIEPGKMWDAILDVLKRKAAEGVEVRLIYDGFGCLTHLPRSYPKELAQYGIKCHAFLQPIPLFSTYQNNRDHRKILVVDGRIAYNGGVNLADEYINEKVRFGYWKDIVARLEGEAVLGFTMMFLEMWNASYKKNEAVPEDYERYITIPLVEEKDESLGFVTPYGDSPLDGKQVGETVYMDLIHTSRNYVHIMSPYLILDNEMVTALLYAAKRGVDVKIILPHIPDKAIAFALARNHYPQLLEGGVKIYEFTPGFVHAKLFTVDDEKAVIGSINLDYRSLYLHFECATYLLQNPVIADMEADFQETLKQCQEMTIADYKKFPFGQRLMGQVFKFFAPLM